MHIATDGTMREQCLLLSNVSTMLDWPKGKERDGFLRGTLDPGEWASPNDKETYVSGEVR